ncbi:Chloronitrobenzene nitroreductase [compost metagenome]
MHIDAAIRSRKSVRRFQPWPVPRHSVQHLLELAARAPSGNNIQPWQVHVVTGEKKQALCEAILQQAQAGNAGEAEYRYYPDQWHEPYLSRRRAVGFGLYQALGIDRHDLAARRDQELQNFSFFDAPVGLLISLDRRLNTGSYLDLGMFIQTFMLAARGKGLHSCPQAAFAWYHEVVRRHVPLPPEHILVCGIALGYADAEAAVNTFATPREPVRSFASFHGFETAGET